MSLRWRSHQTKQVDDACSEHHEVNDDEGQQRRRNRRCRNRRMRIRSQQKSVYREGLTADFRVLLLTNPARTRPQAGLQAMAAARPIPVAANQ